MAGVDFLDFQSTLPVRGATGGYHHQRHPVRRFQSTLPVRGATPRSCGILCCPGFSIHAPRKGSDMYIDRLSGNILFSIHAPRKGSDKSGAASWFWDKNFQSTLPVRGATGSVRIKWRQVSFQSTLPVRGATRWGRNTAHTSSFSIHAPRKGSDAGLVDKGHSPVRFQSTLPVRGATNVGDVRQFSKLFSIHAPRKGSDLQPSPEALVCRFSIHAPRKGSDNSLIYHVFRTKFFNPRSP